METGPVPSASLDAARAGGVAAAPAASSGPQIVIERPPPGLARGKYAWPAWGIATLGGLLIALGVAFLIWRARRRKSDARAGRDGRTTP